MINTVSFPGLGLEFELNRVAVSLFGHNKIGRAHV